MDGCLKWGLFNAVVEDFFVPMRGIHDCFDCIIVYRPLKRGQRIGNFEVGVGEWKWLCTVCITLEYRAKSEEKEKKIRTDVAAKVGGLVDFDAEVWLDFADNFDGVVEG